jgi:hypothetical protein
LARRDFDFLAGRLQAPNTAATKYQAPSAPRPNRGHLRVRECSGLQVALADPINWQCHPAAGRGDERSAALHLTYRSARAVRALSLANRLHSRIQHQADASAAAISTP